MVENRNSLINQVRWKIDILRKYSESEFFSVTPNFIIKEFLSKQMRLENLKRYLDNECDKKLSLLSEEDKRELIEAKLFLKEHLELLPDLRRFELMNYAMSKACQNGIFAEFGVYKGESINYIASKTPKVVHGFDSFQGLPEDWNPYHKKGHFYVGDKRLPKVAKNVRLHVGLFSRTIPQFKNDIGDQQISFLHVDCDLYSSTKDIFGNLAKNIGPGTVILFDELYNYPGWKKHEYRAFVEFCEKEKVKFSYIGYNGAAEQVAVLIK